MYSLLVIGRWKVTTNQYAEEKMWVFSGDLKEESEAEYLAERGEDFQITGPMYWNDLFPR